MTPHELAAPAVHQALGGETAYVEQTPEISVEDIAAAIRDLADDWRIDVEFEAQESHVVIRHAARRPDSLVDQAE